MTYIVKGFDAGAVAAGIKKNGATDLALVASRVPCRAAGVFTRNLFPAAPVIYDRQLLAFNPEAIHAVLVNAGCANACTGPEGNANARLAAEQTALHLGAHEHSVFVMSTGVIGVQLPMEKLLAGIPKVVETLAPDGWPAAAAAIMTTDTRPKLATRQVILGDVTATITGIAKGAGMIHPNMATMLAVIATDAFIAQPLLQQTLTAAVDLSFNRISVDGDTSTNDTVLLLANSLADNEEITDAGSSTYAAFSAALTDLCTELAQAIVRDGEGATRFVTVHVRGATSDVAAHQAANTIATSPLVKTAFFGGDANWGRILAAVGRAGIQVDPARCDLFIDGGPDAQTRNGELQLVAGGVPLPYSEDAASAIFAQPEIDVRVELGLGVGAATVWTSDLSYDYVRINGDYRT
ncbi:MAG TPA: ornithine acetyltransferase [Chloroflexi bacterium]|nr:ornithine acetyltransferase [Chloroflexota bacterium]HHW86747.1 bifunctional glutamate N-acetyltransferase/amino-acid acetyltransferase ArgJ [Chloroflexota bacterium]